MCTLTWWPQPGRYTLYFNRDEQKSRLPALPPQAHQTEAGTRFISPLDGNFGGTWLLVTEHGLTIGLLNHYAAAEGYEPDHPKSRGMLPLILADCQTVQQVGRRLMELPLETFRPFHCTAIDPGTPLQQWTWHGNGRLLEHEIAPQPPLTTSSFESAAVCAARRQRFHALEQDSLPQALEGYHEGVDPDRGAYSVRMRRSDAQTVSISRISVDEHAIAFEYRPETIDSLEMNSPAKVELKRFRTPST
jgi:hypothetical protein